MKKGYLALIAAAVLGALVIAGCGSSNDETTSESASGGSAENASAEGGAYGGAYGGGGESSSTTAGETSSEGGGTTFVSTGKAGDLGQVIVNSEGMTLYDFHKDKGTNVVLLRSMRRVLASTHHLRRTDGQGRRPGVDAGDDRT